MKSSSLTGFRPAFAIAASALALFALPAQAVITYSSGTFAGSPGIDSQGGAGPGSAGLYLTNSDVLINGANFIGGSGGFASSVFYDPGDGSGLMAFLGTGGNGGAALSATGGNITISGGNFIGGAAGGGTGSEGSPGGVLQISGGATVLITGGNFIPGSGANPAPAYFDVGGNSTVTLDGNFGASNGLTLTGSGTLAGKFTDNASAGSYTYSVAPGSSLVIIPEPSASLLALAAPALMFMRRRRA